MKVRAYAKVNLALDVVRKRADGYSAVKKAGGGCVLFQCQKEAPVVINERKKVTVKELKQLRKREKICILM